MYEHAVTMVSTSCVGVGGCLMQHHQAERHGPLPKEFQQMDLGSPEVRLLAAQKLNDGYTKTR